LALKLQDTLELTEEQLDVALAKASSFNKIKVSWIPYICANECLDIRESKRHSRNVIIFGLQVCCNFNAEQYSKVQEAYCMLGKTQTSMDQLQMHVTSAVHNTAWNVVYGHAMLSNPAELVRNLMTILSNVNFLKFICSVACMRFLHYPILMYYKELFLVFVNNSKLFKMNRNALIVKNPLTRNFISAGSF
jgi:hypothetical protein